MVIVILNWRNVFGARLKLKKEEFIIVQKIYYLMNIIENSMIENSWQQHKNFILEKLIFYLQAHFVSCLGYNGHIVSVSP